LQKESSSNKCPDGGIVPIKQKSLISGFIEHPRKFKQSKALSFVNFRE
jgi:hypothetical protein